MKENLENIDSTNGEKSITKEERNSELNEEEYHYSTAGIRERPGYIPIWLVLVTVGLLLWGAYYLATYWSPS